MSTAERTAAERRLIAAVADWFSESADPEERRNAASLAQWRDSIPEPAGVADMFNDSLDAAELAAGWSA